MEKTEEFDKWFRKLKDIKAKAKILLRLQRVQEGNLGDISSVGAASMKLEFISDLATGFISRITKRG